jgi:hypothetical protein
MEVYDSGPIQYLFLYSGDEGLTQLVLHYFCLLEVVRLRVLLLYCL